MLETMTFAQCLLKLMQKHQLTPGNLATMIGGRADLKQVLTDDATPHRRNRVFEKLKASGLFDEGDYEQLAHSLEISRLGIERFRFQDAISSVLAGSTPQMTSIIRTDVGQTLEQRFSILEEAEKIEIVCFNCCYHSLFSVLMPLFKDPQRNIIMRHYIHSDSSLNTAAEYVAVVVPLLFDGRYFPYIRPTTLETKLPALDGQILFIRAEIANEVTEMAFVLSSDLLAYELPNVSACHMFSFVNRVLEGVQPPPVLIKEINPYQLDFSSLCMTFLSHELNRATYYIGSDLCFHQTPTDIAMAAFRDKGLLSDEETARLIERTLSIHEQRYQNQYRKKKPTYRIMTRSGCERFLATGESTDHFVGFRPYTPEERKVIFGNMLKAARQNSYFIPLLLIDTGFAHRYNLVCYDKLGVSIDAKDTDYDISNGYRSVFLMFPEFTKQYLEYYLDILVGEKCYSRQKSLEMLEEMYHQFLLKNNLSE